MALLFALNSFSERHKDRNTEVGTDIPCTWNKPRKISVPLPVEELDFRKETATPKPKEAFRTVYNPASLTPKFSVQNIKDELYHEILPSLAIIQPCVTSILPNKLYKFATFYCFLHFLTRGT